MSPAEVDGRQVVPKIVTVTSGQVAAAKFLIERAEKAGKPVDPALRAIADAKRAPERAAS